MMELVKTQRSDSIDKTELIIQRHKYILHKYKKADIYKLPTSSKTLVGAIGEVYH